MSYNKTISDYLTELSNPAKNYKRTIVDINTMFETLPPVHQEFVLETLIKKFTKAAPVEPTPLNVPAGPPLKQTARGIRYSKEDAIKVRDAWATGAYLNVTAICKEFKMNRSTARSMIQGKHHALQS